MSILTRIKNNQITDNTIEYQKLKDGTLVGTKFNANLTLNSNVVILGNLTVANSYAQLNSVNTYINDPIVVFNNNYTSSPAYDIGMLINRNLDSVAPWGAVNAAWVWVEASDAFQGIMTTETGTTAGAINNSGFANLYIGNVWANTISVRDTTTSTDYTNGAFVVAGAVGIGGNVNINGATRMASNVVAYSGTQSTNPTTGAMVVVGGLGVTANTNIGENLRVQGNAFIDGNLFVNGTQTILGTTDLAVIDAVINMHTQANLAPWTVNDGKDIGIKFHYYDTQDSHAFIGRDNATGALEYYDRGIEGFGNVFQGNTYGVIKAGEFFASNTTESTSSTTGAFRTQGGAGIASNLFVGKSATFNSTQTNNQNFIVKGNVDQTLLWARSSNTYDQVLIGNSAVVANLVAGAKLYINSTDSIRLPTGTTAQRPSSSGGTDVAGMFRYNTTVGALEVYDGGEWDAITTQFTVITSEVFNGDDTTVAFTMANASTTAATIVAVNGIIQQPTTAYSVSGTTLTFTEAPATGDVIDVRRMLTTSQVTGIASTNGYMQVLVDNAGVYIYTGTNSTAATTYWEPSGAQVESSANVSVSYSNAKAILDTFFANTYRSAVYEVQLTSDGNKYQTQSVTLVHDSANVTYAVHGVVQTNGNCGLIEANIGSGKVNLLLSPAFNSNDVRIKKDYILI